jgi:hypothetical protein
MFSQFPPPQDDEEAKFKPGVAATATSIELKLNYITNSQGVNRVLDAFPYTVQAKIKPNSCGPGPASLSISFVCAKRVIFSAPAPLAGY